MTSEPRPQRGQKARNRRVNAGHDHSPPNLAGSAARPGELAAASAGAPDARLGDVRHHPYVRLRQAGVSFAGLTADKLTDQLTLDVALDCSWESSAGHLVQRLGDRFWLMPALVVGSAWWRRRAGFLSKPLSSSAGRSSAGMRAGLHRRGRLSTFWTTFEPACGSFQHS